MFSNYKKSVHLSEIERVKPYLQMAVHTKQLDKSTLKSMVDVLTKNATNTEKSTPKMLTRKEVADLLNVSTKTVSRLTEAGKLKIYKVGKRACRFSLEEVLAYVEGGYDHEN